jgi:hypothetical protein
MNYLRLFLTASVVLLITSCNQKGGETKAKTTDAEILHSNEKNLTRLIIYDIFTPPVASRIYAYTSLAAHEAVRHINPAEPSIVAKLKGFPVMPQPESSKKYDFILASSKAFYTVMFNITFSKDTVIKYEEQTLSDFKDRLDKDVYENSVSFGEAIGNAVMQRAGSDNYKETRGMAKYLGHPDMDGKWRPTAPDYSDGVEPWYSKLKPLSFDSTDQFDPGPPPVFSKDTSSVFYKMNKEVVDVTKNLSQEQKDIAYFWDDNPFVSHHAGHMTFNTKKQTPGGHWMGITAIACRKTNADAVKTARAYALAGTGMFDAFISCWTTKYKYEYVRPITIINDWFDKKWEPYLQTPPFPEYTSGHSTVSASIATVLTSLFGDNFAFHDDANKEYIGMERDFSSFMQASQEASVSRLYGGIHYRLSLDVGVEVGQKIGNHVIGFVNK